MLNKCYIWQDTFTAVAISIATIKPSEHMVHTFLSPNLVYVMQHTKCSPGNCVGDNNYYTSERTHTESWNRIEACSYQWEGIFYKMIISFPKAKEI